MPRSHSTPRFWARRRYSSFFHGESVVTSTRTRSSAHTQKLSIRSQHSSHAQDRQPTSGLRSPTSTRSLIDPCSPPSSTVRSISPDTFERFRRDFHRPALAHVRPQRTPSGANRAERHLARAIFRSQCRQASFETVQVKGGRKCLPTIRSPKIRRKVLGCLVSGGILAVILTICKFWIFSAQLNSQADTLHRPCARYL